MKDTLYFLKMAAIGTIQGVIAISAMMLSIYVFMICISFLSKLLFGVGL